MVSKDPTPPQGEISLSVRLYVGNLPPRLCFPELEDLFTPFGTLTSAELMTDPTTGRSRGFAFVEMESNDAARTAITALNGSVVDGQTLTVNEAGAGRDVGGAPRRSAERPSFARPSGDRPASSPSPGRPPMGSGSGVRLFVGNLPYNAGPADLEKLFAQAGKVTSVNIVTDRATGQSKGFAFIDMGSKDEATAAIQRFDGREGLGRILKVNEARPPERHEGGARPFRRPMGR
jgi:RNA recognition motif-containing protein